MERNIVVDQNQAAHFFNFHHRSLLGYACTDTQKDLELFCDSYRPPQEKKINEFNTQDLKERKK